MSAPVAPTPLEALRELLVDTSRSPVEAVAALAGARRELTDDPLLRHELERQELAFLLAQSERGGATAELDVAVRRARHRFARAEVDGLGKGGRTDPAAVFDAAELRAECMLCGFGAEAAEALVLREAMLESIEDSDELAEEARERWAALASDSEDMPLRHRILVLNETADTFAALGGKTDRRLYRRLSGRLRRTANETGLQERLEGLLTRRGVAFLETFSFVMLLLVVALIGLETVVLDAESDGATIQWLRALDGGICLFFIVEFLFKWSLAPARGSWFMRNVLTDLLPAIPAAFLFMAPSTTALAGKEGLAGVRVLRFFRIVQVARYIQALQPVLRLLRLLLFLVRGMDGLVERFRALLNRNFVFLDSAVPERASAAPGVRRAAFHALRREHVLLSDLTQDSRDPVLRERATLLAEELEGREAVSAVRRTRVTQTRDVSVEQAVEFLYGLRPEDLGQWLPRRDVAALDRVVRVLNAPFIRSLPFLRSLRFDRDHTLPEERVVAFGRRVAARLERWQGRFYFSADLHGIVTGPQILDRVATAMVKASQKPAVRLLLFGSLFMLVRLILGDEWAVSRFLERFVALPLVILGVVCLVFLALGRWLKSLAGEASEAFRLTSEAHFIALLDLVKRREEQRDISFLATRLFRWELDPDQARSVLGGELDWVRHGDRPPDTTAPSALSEDIHRAVLLYLHFLDGAPLHESDVKTTEQLLANLSMENIRQGHLAYSKKAQKRLRKLALQDGTLFGGPYLWFRCITQSVAVEVAKRITEYNRNCLTQEQRANVSAADVEAADDWLSRRLADEGGRTLERLAPPGAGRLYATTEFNALDFLAADADRDDRIERVFGERVLAALRRDRVAMIREIFGTRPLHLLPRSKRSINFYLFYRRRLAGGRWLLTPLYVVWGIARSVGFVAGKTRQIVREILRPQFADAVRVRGRAPFGVALRKIHRMKAPGLLEAMHTRVRFDPAYSGAPPTWSEDLPFEETSELERDMDFLDMLEREREDLRDVASRTRRLVGELHGLSERLPDFAGDADGPFDRRLGERAVTIAYVTNRGDVRNLLRAETWLEDMLPLAEDSQTRIDDGGILIGTLRFSWRLLRPHPVDRWVRRHAPHRAISRRGRRNLRRAWNAREHGVRTMLTPWLRLDAGVAPRAAALAICREAWRNRGAVSRELVALRTVQSLSVLDVANYRSLVFRLGDYAADGEDPALASALP